MDLLLTVIRQLRAEGRAILLCTHALADAELVVDRAVLIHAGATVAQGTLAHFLRKPGPTPSPRRFSRWCGRRWPWLRV